MQQFILPVTSLRWLHWRFSALALIGVNLRNAVQRQKQHLC